MTEQNFQEFFKAYLVCCLWASTQCDEEGQNCRNLDDDYDTDDFAPEALKQAEEECRDFIASAGRLLDTAVTHPGYNWTSAGNDFWLTRCGHGAGFWDRGLPGTVGDGLSELARIAGSRDPYPGDDGLIYFS